MPGGLCLAVCRNYLREFETLLAADGGDDVTLVPYRANCGHPKLDWASLEADLAAAGAEGREVCVIGGGCLQQLDAPPPESLRSCQVLRHEHCHNLIAGPALVGHLLHEGEHLLNPGWLEHWRDYARTWGFDAATAGEFFGETTTRLTLLDTGVLPGAAGLLQEFARFTGRPWRVLPIGLDHLGLVVDRVLERRREKTRRAEASAAIARAGKESADFQMVFDLVGTMADAKGEAEAIGRVLDLFSMLFAPRSLVLARMAGSEILQVGARPPDASCDLEELRRFSEGSSEQSARAGGADFFVRIGHRGETIGVLAVAQVRFPEHIEHYRQVGETVARVCGLALTNARAFQQLQATVAELTAARDNVRTLSGLIPICAHCKKVRDDGGYWQSVERYLQEHSAATLTHGICPTCVEKHFPGYGSKKPGKA